MTEDELKKEAEESFEKYRVTDIDYVVSPYSDDEGEKKLMFNNEYDAEEEYYRLYSKGYLASAETREKRIAELETQIERNKIDLAISEHDREHNDYELTEAYKKIEQLEKENAELIHENARLVTVIDKSKSCGISPLNYLIIKNLDDQLTKAKEIIREFVEWATWQGNSKCPSFKSIQDKAEQFLNSEVEK